MRLQPLMTLRATIGDTLDVGNGGTGHRAVANVTGGTFDGPRLRGTVQNSGADWVIIDATGVGRIDVRIVITTDDGANVLVTYQGLLQYTDAVREALAGGGSTGFGDTLFMTQVRFETGHAGYAWLNHTLAVAEGRLEARAVEYRMFSLEPGE